MSRKQDVLVLFDFLIELLKETQQAIPEEPKTVIQEPVIDEAKKKLDKLFNPEEVRDLMQRVEEMDKQPTFPINPILGDQQRNFESEFKKMVSQVDELTKEKEKNDKGTELDMTAKSDFNIIKSLRNNITPEERASLGYTSSDIMTSNLPDSIKQAMLTRVRTGVSFSG